MLWANEFFDRGPGMVQTPLTYSADRHLRNARRREQPEQHAALNPARLVDERFEKPFKFEQTQLTRARRLRKSEIPRSSYL